MSRHKLSVFHFGAISLLMIVLMGKSKLHYTNDEELQLMFPPNFKSLKHRMKNSDLINSPCSDSILIQQHFACGMVFHIGLPRREKCINDAL